MVGNPLSIRFDPALLERLRRSAASRDTTPSGLAQRLVDEGLRVQEHPGVIFRDGPSGRRAALIGGADVWEVVAALQNSSARADAAITETAVEMGLSLEQVKTALDYFGSYPAEIEEQVAANERAAHQAYLAWAAQQRLLA